MTMSTQEEEDALFILYLTVSLCLVIIAGLMSGLTLGLMSLDMVDLEVFKRSGTPSEQKYATKIMPVVKQQHFLLVTLLLCNAAATEALPICLDKLTHPVTAVILSVTVVLVFGEIIPQAICSRYGLQVGAYSAFFVQILMWITSPISWPISKLLDAVLGPDHTALFRRAQLKALVDLHSAAAGWGGTLSEDEIHIIRGALDMTNKTAGRSMTPLDKVFMLAFDDILDEKTMQSVLMSGHSRIPVHGSGSRKDIRGLILVKELVLLDPSHRIRVADLRLRELPRLSASTPMYDMLKLFKSGRCHMAVLTSMTSQSMSAVASGTLRWPVSKPRGWEPLPDQVDNPIYSSQQQQEVEEPIGIITIEDVIEELLQEEIIDETDNFVDNLQTASVNSATVAGTLPPRLRQVLSAGIFTPRVGKLGAAPKAAILALARSSEKSLKATRSAELLKITVGPTVFASPESVSPTMPSTVNRSVEEGEDDVELPLLRAGPASPRQSGPKRNISRKT